MSRQRRLGRGLDALLTARQREPDTPRDTAMSELPVDRLSPGRYQPRGRIREDDLTELADSIRQQGVLQPLVVRPIPGGAQDGPAHEIVAGERRWRAARLAGLATVPAVVRELDDQSALAVALIENLQREDLNPLDQAHSLARLVQEFGMTHEEVAQALGRSRASVSNLLRLLDLQDEVKELLAQGAIEMGHARAVLSLDAERQVALARRAAARGLSVREVEKAARTAGEPAAADGTRVGIDNQTRWLQQQIGDALGQKLSIRPAKDGSYTLRVGFGDLPQLQQALEKIQGLIAQVRDAAGPRVRELRHEDCDDGTGSESLPASEANH
jgi:ParB family transcriptional regulator, chromosome partitioning protein